MYAYKLFLPAFGKAEINKAIDYLKKKSITLQVDPTVNIYRDPPWDTTLMVSLKVDNNPKWPYPDKTIVSGFELKAYPFDFDQVLKNSGISIGKLFGLAKGNPDKIDFKKALEGRDRGLSTQLKSMKVELSIYDEPEIFAGYYTSMLFATALAKGAGGIIYEGEFVEEGNVERDFMPTKEDLESVLEDIEDGEKPEFFKGWS